MIGRTISHYRIVEKLGEGGMGVVYLAEDTVLGRRVAIKTLTSARGPVTQHFRMRFLREAQAISKLSHPHIANIYDYGETDSGEPYIVMELVEGKTLADLIKSETLTIPRTLEIIKQVAEALEEAHGRGIVHRDIKPSNIAINDRGKVKVLDFGLAKHITTASLTPDNSDEQVPGRTQTREGVIVGTPMYLSPEQALGVPVDARSDLFSLGSVLYECIAGRPAFSGKSDIDICAKVIRDDPPPPSDFNSNVTSELDRITLKVLAKKPEARHQTAKEFVSDLATARGQVSGLDQPIPRTTADARKNHTAKTSTTLSALFRRLPLPVGYVLIGAVLAVLAAIGIWLALQPKPYRPTAEAQHFYELGEAAIREGVFYKASKLFQQSVDADPGFALARARLSETLTELDFTDKAQRELISAKDLVRQSKLTESDGRRLQAITHTVNQEYAKAVEECRNLVELVPESQKKYAVVDLGRAYEKNEESPKAIPHYRDAIRRDPNYAAAFLRLAVVLRRSQNADALPAFDEAYRLFNLSNELEGMTEVLYQRGILLSQQGKVPEAAAQFQQALTKSAALEHMDQRVKTLLQLSNVSIIAGDAKKAEDFSRQGLDLAKASGMENLFTASLIDIGNSHLIKERYAEAEASFLHALALATSFNGRRNEARALLSMASLRTRQGKPDDARLFFDRAVPFYQQGGYRKEISQARTILGDAYDQQGNYDEALKAFKELLRVAEQVGDSQQIALSHERLGLVLNHQQNYPSALAHYEEQWKIVDQLGQRLALGYALLNRGRMLWQIGYYNQADLPLNGAFAIANDPNEPNKKLLAWVRLSKAQLALSKRDLPTAIAEGTEAVKLAGTDFEEIAVHAGYTLGLAQSLAGQPVEGRLNCEQSVKLGRSLSDPLPLSHALLALALSALQRGDAPRALASAKEAQERFTTAKQYESEWRAWTVQAIAAAKLGERERARKAESQADVVLAILEQQWGSENYKSYHTRTDVKVMRETIQALEL